MTKHLAEFPSEWHQEAYVEGLKREALGYERRIAELRDLGIKDDERALADALSGQKAVAAELERVSGKKKAAPKRKAKK